MIFKYLKCLTSYLEYEQNIKYLKFKSSFHVTFLIIDFFNKIHVISKITGTVRDTKKSLVITISSFFLEEKERNG